MAKKSETLTLRLEPELKAELKKFAEAKGISITQLIKREILLELRGTFLHCPQCNHPIMDQREIAIIGKSIVECYQCDLQFEHDFGGQ